MNTNVLEWLEAAAEKYPAKIAFADIDKSITYAELIKYARLIGSRIIELAEDAKQEWKNKPIAVLIDRNIESLILFMGIVYSGNFYVPIDDTMPGKRVELIMNTLNPVLVINSKEKTGLQMEGLLSYAEMTEGKVWEEKLSEIRENSIDTDPLYAIFTSGSTGIPKGVLINHRSVIDLVHQFVNTFDFPKEPIFGNQAPMDFDVSTKDIYNCLYLGGTLQIIPKQYFVLPVKLIPYLNERKINVIIWAVSALRIAANFKVFEVCRPEHLSLVMFSGEVLSVKDLHYWQRVLPEAQFVNLYGPTEITCNCSYYIIDREYKETESLPIGKPFRNTGLFLWDNEEQRQIKNPGEIGEICVKGTCLAAGYYNNQEKTAEVFIQNPTQNDYPEIVYKTGDLGRFDESGLLYFAARKDYQIKHMGHRIELGEIEVAVNSLDFVDVGCCIYDERSEKIVLCYQTKAPCDREIVKALSKCLPKFMWPNRYVHYERLPMNKNSKIDRVLLKETYGGGKSNG